MATKINHNYARYSETQIEWVISEKFGVTKLHGTRYSLIFNYDGRQVNVPRPPGVDFAIRIEGHNKVVYNLTITRSN